MKRVGKDEFCTKMHGNPRAESDSKVAASSIWSLIVNCFQIKFRNVLLPALFFAGIIAMSSCTKNYTCHCDIKYSGTPGLPDSTSKEYSITDTKSQAKTKCQNESGTYDNNGIHTVENCYLY